MEESNDIQDKSPAIDSLRAFTEELGHEKKIGNMNNPRSHHSHDADAVADPISISIRQNQGSHPIRKSLQLQSTSRSNVSAHFNCLKVAGFQDQSNHVEDPFEQVISGLQMIELGNLDAKDP